MQCKFNGNQNCLITNILQEISSQSVIQICKLFFWVDNPFYKQISYFIHASRWQCKVQDYWDEEEPGKNKNKYMINNTNKESVDCNWKNRIYIYILFHIIFFWNNL